MTNVFAVFVIFIVLAIIIPLPTPILDFLLAILLLLVSVPVYWIFGERGILPVLFILAFMQWALNFRYSRLYFF